MKRKTFHSLCVATVSLETHCSGSLPFLSVFSQLQIVTDIYVTVTRHKLANVSDALCMSDGVPLRAFLRRMVVWFV